MNLLLDTQLVLWWLNGSPELTHEAYTSIVSAKSEIYVSKASLWEIVIKGSLGKLRGEARKIADEIVHNGFRWLDVEVDHVLRLNELYSYKDHKDPFDRLLVAQSLSEQMILLTADAKPARYSPTVRVL